MIIGEKRHSQNVQRSIHTNYYNVKYLHLVTFLYEAFDLGWSSNKMLFKY